MNSIFRFSIIAAVIMGWIGYYSYVFINGFYDSSVFLPFHLCNIMEILIVVALWTKNYKILDIIVYPLILGPVVALSHPLGTFELGGIFSFYFVYYHVLLLTTGIAYLFMTKFKTSYVRIFHGALFVFSCDVIAFIVNSLTGGNYMFIGETAGYPPLAYYSSLFVLVWLFLICFHLLIKLIGTKHSAVVKGSF